MVGKSVSEKLAEKKADDGFEKVVPVAGEGGRHFMSFANEPEGATFIGEFIEISGGTYGDEASLMDEHGVIQVITLTAGLKGPMKLVKAGDMVKITHLGLKDSKNFKGKQFRAFDVSVKRKK